MTKFESLLNSYTGECYAHANGCERRAEWVESNRAELIAYVAALEAALKTERDERLDLADRKRRVEQDRDEKFSRLEYAETALAEAREEIAFKNKLIGSMEEHGSAQASELAALEAALHTTRKRLARYEPTDGCEEAWSEYVSLRKQIRQSTDDAEKEALMARAMEVARPFDFTSLEMRELKDELAAARAENERLRKTGLELAHVIDSAGRCGCSQCIEMEHRVLAALRARPDDGRVERAARWMWTAIGDGSRSATTWDVAVERWPEVVEEYRKQARAALAAADGEVKP